MKRTFSKITVVLVLLCVLSLGIFVGSGCRKKDNNNKGGNEDAFVLELNQTKIDAIVGEFHTLKAINVDTDAVLVWTSSDQNVVAVDDNGKIEALKEGTAKVTADYLTYKAECTVNVSFGKEVPQLVIKNAGNEFVIGKSQTTFPFDVSVLFNGRYYNDIIISCVSDDEGIVGFDTNGNVIPKSTGTTEVFVSATWRGLNKDRFASLSTKISVTVLDEVLYWVNGLPENEVFLHALPEHNGVDYTNQTDFVITGEFNGQAVATENIEVACPSFVKYDEASKKLTALASGEGKVLFSYTIDGKTLSGSVKVAVERIEDDFNVNLDYFSSNTGTYKDHNDGWKNKSVIDTVFNGLDADVYALDTLKAYQGHKELNIEDGKLLGLNVNYSSEYQTVVKFETDRFVYNVNMTVYGLVIKEAQDLKNLELKIIKGDSPRTRGLDETQVTCIDGYVALLNSIDAKDIKLDHSAMYARYGYRKADGSVVTQTITPNRYQYATHNRVEVADHITGKFGFIGNFDGRGNTIFNLDVSTPNVDTIGGAGVFGYAFGNFSVKDVAFKNLNCSNSCGLVNQSKSWGGHGTKIDPLGLRIGSPTWNNVYIHLSKNTVNPQGAFMKDGAGHMYNNISNVVIDATEVKLGSAKSGGVFTNQEYAACPYEASDGYYYSSSELYIISPEVPAYFTQNVKIVGRNNASSKDLLRLPLAKVNEKLGDTTNKFRYSADFYSYSSYDEFAGANHDLATFSDSWATYSYPVYKTSKEAIVKYDESVKFDDKIIVSSASKDRTIELFSFADNSEFTNVTFTEVDSSKLLITTEDNVATIKLANDVTSSSTATLKVTYMLNGVAGELNIDVSVMQSLIKVDTELSVSAINFAEDIKDSIVAGQEIVSVKQSINGGAETDIAVSDGVVSKLGVKINENYSDVMSSKLIVETTDLKYEFANVKVYSHIIRTGEDLKVFEQPIDDDANNILNGYYILANNVDATGIVLNHAPISTGMARFCGVLDGRGYAIKNFEPRDTGLLRAVRSESGSHVEIKDIAFLNVKLYEGLGDNTKDNRGFSILGKQISTVGEPAIIKNVHVQIDKTKVGGWPDHSMYKGLFSDAVSKDSFKMENVYINISIDDSPLSVYQNSGTILGRDRDMVKKDENENIIRLTEIERKESKRFTNVVTISELNPCIYTDIHGTEVVKLPEMGYLVYAENMIGQNGKIFISNQDAPKDPNTNTQVAEHPVISDNPDKGSFIYYGVYKYAEEELVPTDKMSIFTATGLWELVDKEIEVPGVDGAEPTTETVQVLQWKSAK